ncbi:MAG: hypothetical protein ACLVJ6_05175, partial [Merdibacter sp.]
IMCERNVNTRGSSHVFALSCRKKEKCCTSRPMSQPTAGVMRSSGRNESVCTMESVQSDGKIMSMER